MNKFVLFLLFLLFPACSANGDDTEIIDLDEQPSAIQVMFASDDFAVGQPRIAIILFDGPDTAQNIDSVTVTLFDVAVDPPEMVWEGEASPFPDGAIPYWIIKPTIEKAGSWGLNITTVTTDGETESYQRLIAVTEEPSSPAIGSMAPASDNRTVATTPLAELTSADSPNPALYQLTVAEAIDSGKPSVITLATPAFCQTQICAPVVSIVEQTYASVGDRANFIHLEIYEDFQNLTNTPEVEEWGLTSEPWTFVLDGDGVVVARLGGPISEQEIRDYLDPLLES